jgi:hypothetical protein
MAAGLDLSHIGRGGRARRDQAVQRQVQKVLTSGPGEQRQRRGCGGWWRCSLGCCGWSSGGSVGQRQAFLQFPEFGFQGQESSNDGFAIEFFWTGGAHRREEVGCCRGGVRWRGVSPRRLGDAESEYEERREGAQEGLRFCSECEDRSACGRRASTIERSGQRGSAGGAVRTGLRTEAGVETAAHRRSGGEPGARRHRRQGTGDEIPLQQAGVAALPLERRGTFDVQRSVRMLGFRRDQPGGGETGLFGVRSVGVELQRAVQDAGEQQSPGGERNPTRRRAWPVSCRRKPHEVTVAGSTWGVSGSGDSLSWASVRYSNITTPVSASRPARAISPTHTATLML